MRLPLIKSKNTYKRRMAEFGGLNLTENFAEGEMRDCSAISHEFFPAVTQRKASVTVFECNNPTAAVAGKQECIAADDFLYYDKKAVGELSPGKKTMLQVGNKIVVFPDKVYYDTDEKKFARLDGNCKLSGISVTFSGSSVTAENNVFESVSKREILYLGGNSEIFKYSGAQIEDGKINLSGAELIQAKDLKKDDIFLETSGNMYYRVAQDTEITDGGHVKITNDCISVENISKDLFLEFRTGDIVSVSGSSDSYNNKEVKVMGVSGNKLIFNENTFHELTETADIVIKRKIPDFSCVCSYENRLWGCEGNTVYASKLGDPLNFFVYDNLSTDSFAVESNTPGEFTAIVSYGNCCLLFKENSAYKLYGNRPANFQLVENYASGILKDSTASIVNLSGRLFYKGNGGVFSSFGSIPSCISNKIRNIKMINAVGGGINHLYYITADTENGREEFVYDIEHNLWSKSGVKNVNGYFTSGEAIYRLMPWGIDQITEETDEKCEWFIEFCPFDENYHKTKNYIKLYITAELFENAYLKVHVKGDDNNWRTVVTRYGKKKEYITVPCVIKNCHEARLRISGKGKSIIESVVREFGINQG